jgi:hypothetical protein
MGASGVVERDWQGKIIAPAARSVSLAASCVEAQIVRAAGFFAAGWFWALILLLLFF